ncbi:MAG: tetratricopeptide repeat protein [Cyanobacteria bacterium SBLK]|nr:tetratricopeptide repeat protein [Cyanobacteria bacterium SBLK]
MSSRQKLNPLLIESFVRLIAKRTGLEIQERDCKILERAIQSRMKSLHLSAVNSYYNCLADETQQNSQEWQTLIGLLTNPESYFFRDRGQFSLLKGHIFPELIERRQQAKTLRVWSAGCSTGEEVYSLAILLEELLPDIDCWNLFILGTDINLITLQKAREGLYGNWSFRSSDTELQQQYFHATDRGYLLHERIRRRVQFHYSNLADLSSFPYNDPNYFDLIICRNVFIYFSQTATQNALMSFSQLLSFDGYLLTGHAELYGQDLTLFQSKIFPESILYQKNVRRRENEKEVLLKDANTPRIANPSIRLKSSRERDPEISLKPEFNALHASRDRQDYLSTASIPIWVEEQNRVSLEQCLQEAETLFLQKEYIAAIARAKYALNLKPKSFDAFYLLAKIHANSGQYQQAINCCQKALKIDGFSVNIYYLLAQISRECGNFTEEKKYYKKIVYLEPNSIAAYRELAYLYHCEGDRDRANKMYYTALELERQSTSKE